MNKKEWREERRKWRLINRSTFPDDSIQASKDKKMVRDYLFGLVYKDSPSWFWSTRPRYHYYFSPIKDKWDIRCNLTSSPNSYPHKTRNP